LTAFCYSIVSVVTRVMQRLHFAVTLSYYSIIASVVTFMIIYTEKLVKKDETLRILTLSW
jgi:hypothetical protein